MLAATKDLKGMCCNFYSSLLQLIYFSPASRADGPPDDHSRSSCRIRERSTASKRQPDTPSSLTPEPHPCADRELDAADIASRREMEVALRQAAELYRRELSAKGAEAHALRHELR